ncbi:MAG: nucleotidyltransferase domain-containing protein [Reyranella sp.]
MPGRVVRVMLYGSRARDDARPDSDWDVAAFIAGDLTSASGSAVAGIPWDSDGGGWDSLGF